MIPPSVTSIASEAFDNNAAALVIVKAGSYADSWCNNKGMFTVTDNEPIISIDAPTTTFSNATVTCQADVTYYWPSWDYHWNYSSFFPYYDGSSYQWQCSIDNVSWTDATLTGSCTDTISFPAESPYVDAFYRCVITDPLGTWYSDSINVGITNEKPVITGAVVTGNQVTLTWTEPPVESCTYTIERAKGSEPFSVFTEGTTSDNWILQGLAINTEYRFRIVAVINGFRMESEPVTITTQNYVIGTAYRALLIGEVNFDPICNRNSGDVNLMANMLASITGPDEGHYQIAQQLNVSATEILDIIPSFFADASDNDVSLFFIATHGDSYNSGILAGALAMVDENGNMDFLLMCDLAECLSQVPGKVIVILQSCGSGAAIYDPDMVQNGKRGQEAELPDAEAFTKAAITAFSSQDPGLDLSPTVYQFDKNGNRIPPSATKTGEFRDPKFYVLASARYLQYSWGTEWGPFNFFTFDLTNGIGTNGPMPADTEYGNNDGTATLHELFSYIKDVGDGREYYDEDTGELVHQNVQVYPTNCSYELFMREINE